MRIEVHEDDQSKPVSRLHAQSNEFLIDFINKALLTPWSEEELKSGKRFLLPEGTEINSSLDRILSLFQGCNSDPHYRHDPDKWYCYGYYDDKGRVRVVFR